MKKILMLVFILMGKWCWGQVTFQKTYTGSAVIDMQPTSDGGIIMAGYALGGSGYDFYVLKLDYYGNILWSKTYGGPQDDYANSIQQTRDGGYIVAGYSNSFSSSNANYLIKIDVTGNLIWSKAYTGVYSQDNNNVKQTSDGGYIVVSSTTLFGNGGVDIYVIKTDSMGTMEWAKAYGTSRTEYGNSVLETPGGDFIIGGWGNAPDTNNLYAHCSLTKITSTGQLIWNNSYVEGSLADNLLKVLRTDDGGYFLIGGTYNYGYHNGQRDIYLVKTDSAGNISWSKTYGTAGDDGAQDIRKTSDGDYIIAGTISSGGYDGYLMKINSAGDTLWTKAYGGIYTDDMRRAFQAADGGYYATGYVTSFGSVFLMKTNAVGNTFCNERNYPLLITSPNSTVTSRLIYETNATPTEISANTNVNNFGSVSTLCSSADITEVFPLAFNLYPNPAHNSFTISLNELTVDNGQLTVLDITGREVYSDKIVNRTSYIVNQNLSPGVYFVKVTAGERVWTEKVVVE